MSHIFGKKTLKTLELFGVPLQTYLAYTVNILFKFIWGLRNISKDKNVPVIMNVGMMLKRCKLTGWRLTFFNNFFQNLQQQNFVA